MTERALDNIRIASKVLAFLAVPLGLLWLVTVFGIFFPSSPVRSSDVYPADTSELEEFFAILTIIGVLLTFALPILVLRRELQKRKAISTIIPDLSPQR